MMMGPGFGGAGGGMMMMGGGGSKSVFYYNKGYDLLKKATYDNLTFDLKDNDNSMFELAKYNRAKKNQTLAYVLGSAALLVGMFTAFEGTGETKTGYNFETRRNETYEETNLKVPNLVMGLAGFVTVAITMGNHSKKNKYIFEAVNVYNK